MCIRDRLGAGRVGAERLLDRQTQLIGQREPAQRLARLHACLLYTSDAADERSSVDLGGRRILKKKFT